MLPVATGIGRVSNRELRVHFAPIWERLRVYYEMSLASAMTLAGYKRSFVERILPTCANGRRLKRPRFGGERDSSDERNHLDFCANHS